MGTWPARLPEGYTALIPKEGPPGPLNTRPLTVHGLQVVGGRALADAIVGQESWAHPAAFGFRPARSALDRAVVTRVLLELCRLRGWAVAGMSIDYIKCFDLIPQAVMLAPALELGMDPGTCQWGPTLCTCGRAPVAMQYNGDPHRAPAAVHLWPCSAMGTHTVHLWPCSTMGTHTVHLRPCSTMGTHTVHLRPCSLMGTHTVHLWPCSTMGTHTVRSAGQLLGAG